MTGAFEAVESDLAALAQRDPALASSGLAAVALAMAAELDDPQNSATSKSMCAARLQDALERLRELSPPLQVRSSVDDIRDDLARRRRAAAAKV